MGVDTSGILADLGGYAAAIASSLDHEDRPYPVLGAEGSEFAIEIAVGPRDSRRILKTIYVDIRQDQITLPTDDTNRESMFVLPEASWLIAFLRLLEYALGANTQILHPLSQYGDFLPGWHQAVTSASARNLV